MIRVFLDSSVLFAASYSSTGASRGIIRQAIREKLSLVVSQLVLEETEENLKEKAPFALPVFHQILDTIRFEFIRPTKRQVIQAAQYTALKDAPIIAAAKRARVDYLVSLDRRHLVGIPELSRQSGVKIVLPEELIGILRQENQ